ncbi:AAA family ATPase [Lysinibacillus parviboronicapiens]|uniref:AAA family ATPase n=1 Tax=Lysinibacillus parviboronicapiens TaxID=436516 RepID=UPI000D372B37|nr:AAA family ATPase [Lysinibacillus parviboronicapiens]
MSYLSFKKLLVIDLKSKRAKEIIFSDGLNLIIGKNKTGKSSLIKSILHTLGCEVKFDDSWEELINLYYLEVSNGESEFIFARNQKYFYIKTPDNDNFETFITYDDFSERFNTIFNINLKITNNNGESVIPTPALLFSYQFIDQDIGWSNIPNRFPNMSHFFEADKMSILYITDTLPNEYFIEKEKKDILKKKISAQEKNNNEVSGFLGTLYEKLNIQEIESNPDIPIHEESILRLVNEINNTENKIIDLKKMIVSEENIINQSRKVLSIIKGNIDELVKDIKYSNSLPSKLVCPICHTSHTNEFPEILGLISEKDELEILKKETRQHIKLSNENIANYQNDIVVLEIELEHLKTAIEKLDNQSPFIENIKQEGVLEMANASKELLEEQIGILEGMQLDYIKLDQKVKELSSKKITSGLTKSLKDLYHSNAEALNLELASPSFTNFRPSLKNYSGSDLTRAIYSYYLSVFEYNIFNSTYPFRFLIIDTPNHQGQDEENLLTIYSRLLYMSTLEGQLIMVTERTTGSEDYAHVIELSDYRQVLNKKDYINNLKLIKNLDQ